MRSTRMRMKTQLAWYWRWTINASLAFGAAMVAWWIFQNQHKVTGFNPSQMRDQIASLSAQNRKLTEDLTATGKLLADREQQLQIDKAAQSELARTVAQLQEENATLKEDLGFLRNLMSASGAPDGIAINNLKVERDGSDRDYRYRMLLTQGGQRKQNFQGRVQVVARIISGGQATTLAFPDDATARSSADLDFKYYQKVEGRFSLPPGATLKSVEVRILTIPGGQVRLSKSVNHG
jgi:hypothetical protein